MRKVLFCIVILSLLLVYGCGSSKSDPSNFRTGTKGLVLSSVPGSPPDKFIGEGNIEVALRIKNEGATSIENSRGFGGNIYISGFDKSILHFQRDPPVDGINLLGGRSQYDPVGETEIKVFPASITLQPGVDSYKATLLFTSCYNYETVATPLVCIDPDPFTVTTKQKACQSKDISLSGGQGGPVAITKVDVIPSKEKVRFTITVENAGGGIVYEQSSQNCNPYTSGLSMKEKDQVSVEEVSIAGINLLNFGGCKPLTGKNVNLIDGRRSFICELDLASSGLLNSPAFQSPMVIRVRYGYTDSITKSFEIIRPPDSRGSSSVGGK